MSNFKLNCGHCILFSWIGWRVLLYLLGRLGNIFLFFLFHFKPNMSPFDCVTIWNISIYSYQTQIVTIWSCHHLKLISFFISNQICHDLIMSPYENNSNQSPSWSENEIIHLSDQAFIWWYLSPYEGLIWKLFISVTKKPFHMVMIR